MTDPVLARRIALATALIDKWTGRWFEPRALTLMLDGSGSSVLLLGSPIIAVTEINILLQDFDASESDVELNQVRIYNRHLLGRLDPDDREDPRIEWLSHDTLAENPGALFHQGRWPRGTQNIEVVGTFGYTDPDVGGGSAATGVTPVLIKHAALLLVMKNLPLLADTEARQETAAAHRLTSLRTRDQSISYAGPMSGSGTRLQGAFSGDPEIDNIIAAYCRPPSLGAA